MHIVLGRWTESHIDRIIEKARKIIDPGERVEFLSGLFLKTPYREFTLMGSKDMEEKLVVDLSGVDCFTFIDYVEAMRLAKSFKDFLKKLQRIRYRNGNVSFIDRNHFFTDWIENNSDFVKDITVTVGEVRARSIKKFLNLKEDGSFFLDGIGIKERNIHYIPSHYVTEAFKDHIKTGDYTGIYTEEEGLDVSHVGIIIKREGVLLLRHASSKSNVRAVVDEDFFRYIEDKKGIIVLRPEPVDF